MVGEKYNDYVLFPRFYVYIFVKQVCSSLSVRDSAIEMTVIVSSIYCNNLKTNYTGLCVYILPKI